MVSGPSPEVLDLFVVPDDVEPLAGGQGGSVLAGDLVLTPGRDPGVATWLSPLLARLGVRLDEDPRRTTRDLRVAVPVPARDGSWVVEGWGASRFEPGTTPCRDLAVTLAAGRVLHARLAGVVPTRPPGLDDRTDRWARAESLTFGRHEALLGALAGSGAEGLVPELEEEPLGPDQLVHADLAGNVLLDPYGAPVVIAVSPAWRPVRWAEAVCVLDWVQRFDAPREVPAGWTTGIARQAMLRAVAFRVLSEETGCARYAEVLAQLTT